MTLAASDSLVQVAAVLPLPIVSAGGSDTVADVRVRFRGVYIRAAGLRWLHVDEVSGDLMCRRLSHRLRVSLHARLAM